MQMATVKDTGRMIDKADGYTDDIFRALALMTWALQVEEYVGILNMAPDIENNVRPAAIAASRLYSGGGRVIANGSSSGAGRFIGVTSSSARR